MDTFRDLTTGREYPVGSVGELHRKLDRLVDELDNEGHHLARQHDAPGLGQMGAACQQAARRILKIGVIANTARVNIDQHANPGVA